MTECDPSVNKWMGLNGSGITPLEWVESLFQGFELHSLSAWKLLPNCRFVFGNSVNADETFSSIRYFTLLLKWLMFLLVDSCWYSWKASWSHSKYFWPCKSVEICEAIHIRWGRSHAWHGFSTEFGENNASTPFTQTVTPILCHHTKRG